MQQNLLFFQLGRLWSAIDIDAKYNPSDHKMHGNFWASWINRKRGIGDLCGILELFPNFHEIVCTSTGIFYFMYDSCNPTIKFACEFNRKAKVQFSVVWLALPPSLYKYYWKCWNNSPALTKQAIDLHLCIDMYDFAIIHFINAHLRKALKIFG